MIVDLYVVDKLSNKYCLKVPMNVCNNYGYIFIQLKMTVTMIIKKPLLCKSQWWQEPFHTFQIFVISQM